MRRQPEKKVASENRDAIPGKPNGTDWDRLLMAGFLSFLSSLQLSPLLVILWPYIKQIDPATSVAFYGIIFAVFHACSAVFSSIFSAWSYKTQTFRWPLMAGRVIALLACLFYLFVEYAESGVFVVIYFLLGTAEGSSSVLTIYARCFTAEKDSHVAKKAVTIGYIVGFVFGPVVTVAFSPLEYPSASLGFDKILVNAYTCPVWMSLLTNIFTLVVLCVWFEEYEVKAATRKLVDKCSMSHIREVLVSFRSLPITCLDRYHILCCALVRVATELNYVSFMTITAPTLMNVFKLPGELFVLFFSICIIVSMALSIGVRAVAETSCWNKRPVLDHFCIFIISLCMLDLLSLVIFTLISFCLDDRMSDSIICDANGGSYMLLYMLAMGIVLPLVKLEADRLYSQMTKLNQSIINGCVTFCGEMTLVLAPLYAAFLFSIGFEAFLWITNFLITLMILLFLLPLICIHW